MSAYILRPGEHSIALTHDQVERLLGRGDGDAALLYLLLMMRSGETVPEQELLRRLNWSQLRLQSAESALQELGLIQRPVQQTPPTPAQERPVYSSEELANLLEDDRSFRMLIPQMEEKLGKKLKTADLQIVAGLYDDLGLPADVIYLLVNHCIQRSEERYGPGRRPTLRQIEKEGYYWYQQGLFDQASADEYLRSWRTRQQDQLRYMQVLGLGQRRPVASEEKYLLDWMEKGFPPETVALAYDKTVFYKKQLDWRYLNGILRRWHEKGWHTPEDVEQGDRHPPASPPPSGGKKPNQPQSNMDKYLKW